MKKKIIVIGGGAAGLMAAGQAALSGNAQVTIFEKMARAGRKICITGKGRCNITNIAEVSDFIDHFGPGGRFLRQAFSRFFAPELMEFFEGLGLALVRERGGRVFPASAKAPDVFRVLLKWAVDAGVKISTGLRVEGLIKEETSITGVIAGKEIFHCDALILATGGASYPETGSSGDGYRLASSMGHNIVKTRPALVPLEVAGPMAQRMDGLTLVNTRVDLYIDKKKRGSFFGEISFTDFGVSGPVILTLSSLVVDALARGCAVELVLDLKPALDDKKLDARLLRDFSSRAKEPVTSMLRGLIPREMVPMALDIMGLDPEAKVSGIRAKERATLRRWLKGFRLQVSGHRPVAEAIITAGGVDCSQVEPRSMESRLIKGLFFAGELLDINADTGGYNLQAAFSTGWVAGRSASGALKG